VSMTLDPEKIPFSLLPYRRPPWVEFVLTMGTQGVALFVLAWVGVLHPEILSLPEHDYHFVQLVNTPPPVNHQPQPLRVIRPVEAPRPEALRLPPEVRRKPVTEIPAAPRVNVATSQPVQLPPTTPVIPREMVKTNVFSTGSSATPTIAAAPQKVQTGGFGDPNGVPARESNGRPVTIARLGSFDMPAGPGYGNGTGGATGKRGVVASAGFGNGTALGDGSGSVNTSRGTVVQQAGFGDAMPAAAPVRPKVVEPAVSRTISAEILSKPTPAYTEEAKKLRIEGEVLLEVTFEAGGKIRVLRVVRGLGHGLDESAIRSAEQIRFKPAQRDGQPVDFNAVLHIVFQLA
jgi:TonB family protein